MMASRHSVAQSIPSQQVEQQRTPTPTAGLPVADRDFSIDLSAMTPPPFRAGGGAGAPSSKWTVTPSTPASEELTYDAFIREVVEANLDYAAQRYNVDVAQAQLAAAKLIPNPTMDLVEVAIRAAHELYQSSLVRLGAFKADLLKSTDFLLEARRYSYQHGASTLLDLLEAQRSANETPTAVPASPRRHGQGASRIGTRHECG
jgi:hypothetical protein